MVELCDCVVKKEKVGTKNRRKRKREATAALEGEKPLLSRTSEGELGKDTTVSPLCKFEATQFRTFGFIYIFFHSRRRNERQGGMSRETGWRRSQKGSIQRPRGRNWYDETCRNGFISMKCMVFFVFCSSPDPRSRKVVFWATEAEPALVEGASSSPT